MRIDLPQCGLDTCRYSFDGNCTNEKRYKTCEFAYFKQLEATGRLIELPCKVDDKLYYIAINKNGDREVLSLIPSNIETVLEYKDAIGRWLYLTKEEAEEALKRLQGNE